MQMDLSVNESIKIISFTETLISNPSGVSICTLYKEFILIIIPLCFPF